MHEHTTALRAKHRARAIIIFSTKAPGATWLKAGTCRTCICHSRHCPVEWCSAASAPEWIPVTSPPAGYTSTCSQPRTQTTITRETEYYQAVLLVSSITLDYGLLCFHSTTSPAVQTSACTTLSLYEVTWDANRNSRCMQTDHARTNLQHNVDGSRTLEIGLELIWGSHKQVTRCKVAQHPVPCRVRIDKDILGFCSISKVLQLYIRWGCARWTNHPNRIHWIPSSHGIQQQ